MHVKRLMRWELIVRAVTAQTEVHQAADHPLIRIAEMAHVMAAKLAAAVIRTADHVL